MATTPRDARRGTIPELGEVWQPVGPTMTLLTAHLVPLAAVRALVPAGLPIVPVWPGFTLGATLLSYYGPESTLEYHEFVMAGALVRYGRRIAPFVTHLYVDAADSVTGGRRMGLPKELARFDWTGRWDGTARIVRPDGGELVTIGYGRPVGGIPLSLSGPTITVIDRMVWHFRSVIRGRWGLVRARLDVPPESPLAAVRLGGTIAAVACGPMRGAMGLDMRPLGPLAR